MIPKLVLQIPNIPTPILLAALPIILAGIIGFILGELKARLDTRRSDKAALKKVLYNQLELWEAIRLAEPRSILSKAFRAADKVIHKLGGQPGAFEAAFRETSDKDQQKLLDAMTFNVKEDLIEKYEQSVAELAPVDPILTYKLENKISIGVLAEVNNMIDRLIMTTDPLFLISQSNTQLVEKMKMFYREKGSEWKIKKIKRDIRRVAWRISFRTWLRVLWLFGKERYWISKDVTVATLQLLRMFIEHYSKRNAQSKPATLKTETNPTQHNPSQNTP